MYLDNNASTKPFFKSLAIQQKYSIIYYANPSAGHDFAKETQARLNNWRKHIAQSLGQWSSSMVLDENLYFTSGATEANNIIIGGFKGKIMVSEIEHPSVYNPAMQRNALIAPVDSNGVVILEYLEQNVQPGMLVSIMHSNNVMGAIQPISKIYRIINKKGAYLHTDATQSIGKIIVDLGFCDAMTFSSHKFHGPKGVGAMFIRSELRKKIFPITYGGFQERGLRPGTENLSGIVGMAFSLKKMLDNLMENREYLLSLRNFLEKGLEKMNIYVVAKNTNRLPNTIYFVYPMRLNYTRYGINIGSGSACSNIKGNKKDRIKEIFKVSNNFCYRVSLSIMNTPEECSRFLQVTKKLLEK